MNYIIDFLNTNNRIPTYQDKVFDKQKQQLIPVGAMYYQRKMQAFRSLMIMSQKHPLIMNDIHNFLRNKNDFLNGSLIDEYPESLKKKRKRKNNYDDNIDENNNNNDCDNCDNCDDCDDCDDEKNNKRTKSNENKNKNNNKNSNFDVDMNMNMNADMNADINDDMNFNIDDNLMKLVCPQLNKLAQMWCSLSSSSSSNFMKIT